MDPIDAPGPDPDAITAYITETHPVYAKQRWVSILNPSPPTFEKVVKPLLAETHDRLAAQRLRSS